MSLLHTSVFLLYHLPVRSNSEYVEEAKTCSNDETNNTAAKQTCYEKLKCKTMNIHVPIRSPKALHTNAFNVTKGMLGRNILSFIFSYT